MNWVTLKNPLFASGPSDEFAKFHFKYSCQEPPNELFHYTSEENLINIFKSGNLWATECSYLNDSNEMSAGVKIFQEEINSFDNYLFVDLVNLALHRWTDKSWMFFVVSLSEHGDLLNQWRAYANNGSGCSIAFNAKHIRSRAGFGEFVGLNPDELSSETSNFYHLLKVVYVKEEKKKIARDFLLHAKKTFDDFNFQGRCCVNQI